MTHIQTLKYPAAMRNGWFSSSYLEGIGKFFVAKTRRGICRIALRGGKKIFLRSLPRNIVWVEDDRHFTDLFSHFREFASGRPISFDFSLDLQAGTPFQRAVWKKIAKIPRGETRSYAWLARAVGRPLATRAVANACGANPVPILIPCHRVIASDGSIGGFTGGTKIKRKLLSMDKFAFNLSAMNAS